MFSVRRWWERHGLQLALVSLVLGGAWFLRASEGAAIAEIYHLLVSPWQSNKSKEQLLVNARIQELDQRLTELEQQNQNLQKLLGYYQQQKQKPITSPIIGRSADRWWQQVTLGRGSKDGIKVGFAVTGIGGLVGRVIQVTPNTSRVLLVSDPSSRAGVAIGRSRSMGFLQGQGSQEAKMSLFEKAADVKVGDIVVTSSVSRLYPSGFPVGRVKSVNVTKGPAPEATIQLTAPLNSLEWVFVYPFKSIDLTE
jgi:rod shape-determining protein MreC